MLSAAEECREPSGDCRGISGCLESGHPEHTNQLITPPRRVRVIVAVRLSLVCSVCEQDNSWIYSWMSTTRGRRGQGVTVWKRLNFGANLDPDVAHHHHHHIRFWYLRCCGCPGLRGRQHLATPHTRSPWITCSAIIFPLPLSLHGKSFYSFFPGHVGELVPVQSAVLDFHDAPKKHWWPCHPVLILSWNAVAGISEIENLK